jgi:hypothetical protein
MKKLTYLVVLLFSLATYAQQSIANVTFHDVPREKMNEFLTLHKKFHDVSISDESTVTGGGIFAHKYAGNYSVATYAFYNSESDLEKDTAAAAAARTAYWNSLSDDEKQVVGPQWGNYNKMAVYNHYDEIRISNENSLFWEAENLDWSTNKIMVVSKYNVKWGMNQDFNAGLQQNLKNYQDSGIPVAVYSNRHLYGAGYSFNIYIFYDSWSDFAAFEEGDFQPMNETSKKFWASVADHEDEILVMLGGIDPETKEINYINK